MIETPPRPVSQTTAPPPAVPGRTLRFLFVMHYPGYLRYFDSVVRMLADADPDEVARRRKRLVRALAHFDAATIATTHQFCQRMLDGLGMVGDTDPEAEFTEDVDDLVTEVVDDFYVRKYAAPGADPPRMSREVALDLGRRAAVATRDRWAGLARAAAR